MRSLRVRVCLAASRCSTQSPRMDHSTHPGIHGHGGVGALHSHCIVYKRQKMAALAKQQNFSREVDDSQVYHDASFMSFAQVPNQLQYNVVRSGSIYDLCRVCTTLSQRPQCSFSHPSPFFPRLASEERTSRENFILPPIRRHSSAAREAAAESPPSRRRPQPFRGGAGKKPTGERSASCFR